MLYPHFKNFIAKHDLIQKGEGIVIAASGGIDSMVLLDLVCRLAKSWELAITVAHVNHGLRDRASDADEEFVRQTCARHDIRCETTKRRPPAGNNLQNAARTIRLDFVLDVALRNNARTIATGHHRDDQVETILQHLLRGSGLKGLAGMQPSSEFKRCRLIRPLLASQRSDIERYARERDIAFREDATNATSRYTRNAVRHELIPHLCTFNPRIVTHLARLGERLGEDEEALALMAHAALEDVLITRDDNGVILRRETYLEFPPGLRRRILREAFAAITGHTADLAADHLKRMDDIAQASKPRGSYRLPVTCQFIRNGDVLRMQKHAPAATRVRRRTPKHTT